jgi:ubiquinone/menaquinone biosynthesis C-methylase UbiE
MRRRYLLTSYVFDHHWRKERGRLRSLGSLFDPMSRRRLASLGVGRGWRCLEVGCGAGGIAFWLAEQVGSDGHVLATDLNTRFIARGHWPNLEVREADLLADGIEQEKFDLAHARVLIEHIPDHEAPSRRSSRRSVPAAGC